LSKEYAVIQGTTASGRNSYRVVYCSTFFFGLFRTKWRFISMPFYDLDEANLNLQWLEADGFNVLKFQTEDGSGKTGIRTH